MKRLKIGLVLALISILIAVFAMAGCNDSRINNGTNTLDSNISSLNAKGGLQVSLNFIKKSLSTKASDISDVIDSVTFHITGSNLPAPINQIVQRADFKGPGWAVIQINDLLPGTINVTVEAKDASGNVIATGHQDNITVIPGDTIRIRIDCVINVGSVIIDFVCINCLPTPIVTIPASISPPSPMPTVCASGSCSPTPSSTASPTGTPTPTVSPTGTPTPTPTPTATPTPTPTPQPEPSNVMGWGITVSPDNNYYYLVDDHFDSILKYTSGGVFQSELQHGFNTPCYVAVDSSNNLYVADSLNGKIQKFNSSYVFQSQWGSFKNVRGIAVDSVNNHVYGVDYKNNRIQRFDLDGNYQLTWGSAGIGNGQFMSPVGIAVTSSGNVYVVDMGSCRIQKFDSDGNFITKWGSVGQGNGQFKFPFSLAVDSDSNVYVADYANSRVQKFGPDGTFIAKWDVASWPVGIAVDSSPTKNIYVTFWGKTNPPAIPIVQKISQ